MFGSGIGQDRATSVGWHNGPQEILTSRLGITIVKWDLEWFETSGELLFDQTVEFRHALNST